MKKFFFRKFKKSNEVTYLKKKIFLEIFFSKMETKLYELKRADFQQEKEFFFKSFQII